MCRNITTLRGLEPEATDDEIEAAARQYVRKVSGVQKTSPHTEEAFERAVAGIAHLTRDLLRQLPPRQTTTVGGPTRPPHLVPADRRQLRTGALQVAGASSARTTLSNGSTAGP